ncbi:MAG TPA: hypothetical protein VFM69_00200 [Pricia sp.]|nr:hypothetical protein [Pricia sp.]
MKGVTKEGKLIVEEDGARKEFALKEVALLF